MLILLVFLLLFSALPASAAGLDPMFGKIDLAFERNEGHLDPAVKFLARSPGYNLFLMRDEAVIRLTSPKSPVIRMRFLGQNRHAAVEGVDGLARTTNYLIGKDFQHRTNIRSYKKVRYSEIYPGIDVEYHGNGRLLEYDFVVKPGSNPDNIRIGFSGVRGMSVDASGDLVLKTDAEPIVQRKPHVYQQIDGQEKVVEASYVLRKGHVAFEIGEYDRTRPLIIDPVLVYSTFFGGSKPEVAFGIAVDPQGSVYVTGATASTDDFPMQSAAQSTNKGGATEGFVFKLDPTGTQLVYATFFGGSGTDEGHSIAVDAGGNAYITGFTQSTDFPVVGGFQTTRGGGQDAYFLKLSSSGTAILFSTYLGGSADDRGIGIALDPANNAYITGATASSNFPVLNPFQRTNAGGFADGFLSKLSTTGTLVYSTYVGGIGNDNPLGIAVDGNGSAYVTGWTSSINFPLANAFQSKFGGLDQPIGTDDVFVFKMNPAGTGLDYSTFIGGTGSDEGTRIAVDAFGSAYVTGYTSSLNFPTVRPYQPLLAELTGLDAFILKLAPDGKSLVFSTYFGGFQTESGTGIGVDALGSVFVSGYTTSFDLPTANQTQGFIGGDRDAFVAKFDPAGSVLVFSTFMGGFGADSSTGLTVDAAGNAYVVGLTNSADFPTANPFQGTNAGEQDVFVAKLNVEDIVSSSQFQVAPQGGSSVVTKGSRTDAVFGYAVADPVVQGTQLTGLSIIHRMQNSITVSEVGIPSPPFRELGRLFVDVTSTGRSVLSIANPSDQDVTVDFFYTDQTGTTSQFATTTVKAHEHFSRFITDPPLNIFAPGTLNYMASQPVVTTSFFAETNEASELLISHNPIVDPIAHAQTVGAQTITIPQFAEGGGWKNDIVLVNTSEDRMNGEVRFVSQGSGNQPGALMDVGIGDTNAAASIVEYDIPPRGFQKISTTGSATLSEMPYSANRGTSVVTPGSGPFQVTGWASADSTDPNGRLNGLEIIEYRQLGITQSQVGIVAPALRQTGRFFAEFTDRARPFLAIANPNTDDVTVEVVLTDDTGTASEPVSVVVPANGQYTKFLGDQPISLPNGGKRTVSFSASLPVFFTALRFATNERGDSIQSTIPIVDVTGPIDQPVTIPHFADGIGWKTRVVLVNPSDEELRGEIRFLSQGNAPVEVTGEFGSASVIEYHVQPRSFYELQTNGAQENLSTGTIHIVPFNGFQRPAAYATISNFVIDQDATALAGETRGNTTFEASVEGRVPATSLRFYAEARGDFDGAAPRSIRTSIAIANPSGQPATVQLELTSLDDARLGTSPEITIPAGGQYAAYLHQIPGLDSAPVPFQGVLRLRVLSGTGVTAVTFRVLRNERLDYLVTTTGPLTEDAGIPGRLAFPYVTDSTGYTTQLILINPPGTQNTSGVVHYIAADGTPLPIDTLRLGWVQVIPFAGFNTPYAHLLLQHREAGVLTSIVGVEGELPGRTFRMYTASTGDFDSGINGSSRTGIALANPSEAPAAAVLEVRSLNGTLIRTSQPIVVPPSGQLSLLLNQVPGLETFAVPFEGVLRVVATSPQGITAAAFRAVHNERGNTLFTTTGPLNENAGTSEQLVFPHIAEGGGYTTQFIVIGGSSGEGNAGVLRFFNSDGNPLNLTLATQ